ncbi:MAG: 30S ribosomal protein S8 [Chloroflexi bacterium]|nr:30S ribosomal protein S8 [Chloroflexota bacterium]
MLTRIRNAVMVKHDSVLIPVSKIKLAIAKILKEEGFIGDYQVLRGKPQRMIKVVLRYSDTREPLVAGLKRVSKPGLRIYVKSGDIPRVYRGLGIAVVSTPKGVMTGHQAWKQKLGGELLCYVW